MKNCTLILFAIIALSSCSSNKKTVTTNFDLSNNPYYVKKEKKELNEVEIYDPKIQSEINKIIEKHLDVSISSIAISPITKTDTGYHWKFLNVRNGRSFIGFSDLKFKSVTIKKNNKKANTQISDF